MVERCGSGDPAWESYASRAAGATFCHLPGWARVIDRVWGHEPCHLLARRGEQVTGVLPLNHVRSLLFGSILVSSPNAVYGGAAADDEESRAALVAEAKRLARERRVRFLELRDAAEWPGAAADSELLRKDLYVSFDCPITIDEEALGKQFQRDIRRMVRVAVKNELSAEVAREEHLNAFYDVYATSVRNLGTPVFPKKLFAEFLEEFPATSDILLVKQGARVAGGVLSFYHRGTVMPYLRRRVSGVLQGRREQLHVLGADEERGRPGLHTLRLRAKQEGDRRLRVQARVVDEEYKLPYRFHLVTATELPNLNPTNPRFALAIEGWKRLPLGLTKILGPRLVRSMP